MAGKCLNQKEINQLNRTIEFFWQLMGKLTVKYIETGDVS